MAMASADADEEEARRPRPPALAAEPEEYPMAFESSAAGSPEADRCVSFAPDSPPVTECSQTSSEEEGQPKPTRMERSESGLPLWARSVTMEGDSEETKSEGSSLLLKAFILLVSVVLIPLSCRIFYLEPPTRCALVIFAMLIINLGNVMPLFCTALFVPVLGTLCAVLGEGRSVKATSTLLVGNVFNNTSFMVLGALVINGIFTKCGLEKRFMQLLLGTFSLEGPLFLLFLIMGGTLLCSVLYSGSLVLLAALGSVLEDRVKGRTLPPNAAKRILLGVAFCANAGSSVLPISSPVTLITLSLLGDFGYDIPINTWVAVALPVVLATMFFSWIVLLLMYPVEKVDKASLDASQHTIDTTHNIEITDWHMIFLGVGVLAVLGITIYATQLEPIIGHSACLSLGVVVVVFGSGFMSKEEFCGLDWDILALVGGTNVVAFLVRETGLGVEMADNVVGTGIVEMMPYHGLVAVLILITMVCSTLLQHSITGVLLMPLIVAVGIKLQAAETTAILVAIAVPFGMGMPHSSMDNVLSHRTSFLMGRRSAELKGWDWHIAGGWTSVAGGSLVLTLGYQIALMFYKLPPPVWVVKGMTPDALVPKVVVENIKNIQDGRLTWPSGFVNTSAFTQVTAPSFAASLRQRSAPRLRRRRQGGKTTAAGDEMLRAGAAPPTQ
mmetsp:Transcript_51230/g.166037  ORF Transcript_51230/g.166037 Transcript_51230/m.166037 type:complete len:669 (-) Transcript_51230:45-2051(-)